MQLVKIFSKFVGTKYGVATNSGSSANLITLEALNHVKETIKFVLFNLKQIKDFFINKLNQGALLNSIENKYIDE